MTNTTTAKIVCTARSERPDGQIQLGFSPDYRDGRNAEWSKYTPSLSLSMTVTDTAGLARAQLGDHFTLSFDDVEAGEAPA